MAYPVVPAIPAGNESLTSFQILQNAATADGNGTDYDITGMATVQLLINPTAYTGTVQFFGSIDGTIFIKIRGNQQNTSSFADEVVNPGSIPSLWTFQTAGLTKIRAVLINSGGTSVTVTGVASPQPTIYSKDDGVPTILQSANAISTGSVATLAKAFKNLNGPNNSIVVSCGCGSGTAMTVADTAGNTYTQVGNQAISSTFESAIFIAVGTVQYNGINTVTVTNAGTIASMGMQIYEVKGLLQQVVAQPDQSSVGTATGTTASTSALAPSVPNCLAFLSVGVGTTAEAVTAVTGTPWTVDYSASTVTPVGLFSFGALSLALSTLTPVIPQATIAASKPWVAVAAIFRPIAMGIQGTVTIGGYNYTRVTTAATTLVKTGPGVLHAIVVNTPTATATIEADDALTHTSPVIGAMAAFAASIAPFGLIYDAAFSTGLSVTVGVATVDATIIWR